MKAACVGLWVGLVAAGCGEVWLDPETPEPPATLAEEGAPQAGPTRGPAVLATPACATVSAAALDFGDEVVPGTTAVRIVEVSGCQARDVVLTALDTTGAGFTLRATEGGQRVGAGERHVVRLLVEFRPVVSGRLYDGTLVIHTDDPMRPRIEVALGGRGGWSSSSCAPWTALVDGNERPGLAAPGDALLLEATPPPGIDGKRAKVRWSVVGRPAGSAGWPVERFLDAHDPSLGGPVDDADTPTARFMVDTPGQYLFEAEIAPPASSACAPHVVRIGVEACPCPGDVQVQLVWDLAEGPAPGPGTTDLDLFLVHPAGDTWDHPALSCSAASPTQPWDDPADVSDDPTHDADAAHAPGIENVFLDRVARRDGLYRIGVLQRRPFDWSAVASVRVFLGDRFAWESTGRTLGGGNAFWDVAGVAWNDGRLVVVPIDRLFQTGGAFPDLDHALPPGSACLPDRAPSCTDDLRCVAEPGADHGQCATAHP